MENIEQQLKDSEKRYQELIDNHPDAIGIHIGGKIVYVNKACIQLMGATSASELIGKTVIEFIHPDYRQIVMDRIKKPAKRKA
ncbi:MAG TPA: PAS domain S-box protein [Bacteroidales bacterium]|nr:PAS domain S-box protein [Bacteroidales bacterium]HPS17366.1 PAS domain S-box protein [Bacteroidales bacterium]